MFWKLGLVGKPIAHSLSPNIHRAALMSCGLNGEYHLYETDMSGLEDVVRALRTGDLHGLNVTIPHKERVLDFCDSLDPVAELVGAVNTLALKDKKVIGYNSDVIGLETALRAKWPEIPWRGKKCTIHGAGGAARATCVAMANTGAGEIFIANRTSERASRLAAEMNERLNVPCIAADSESSFSGASLVVQAASMGVNGLDGEEVTNRSASLMKLTHENCVAMDLVYKPILPPFASGALRAGREAVGGLDMLVHQARVSFQLWTEMEVAPQLLDAALRLVIEKRG